MDVSFNNVVESTRQYFQGVPNPGGAGQSSGPYGTTPFWPSSFQQKQPAAQQYARDGSQQPQINQRLAPFSSLQYRPSAGSLPSMASLKPGLEGACVPSYATADPAYPYYQHQFQQHSQHQHGQLQQHQQHQKQLSHHSHQQSLQHPPQQPDQHLPQQNNQRHHTNKDQQTQHQQGRVSQPNHHFSHKQPVIQNHSQSIQNHHPNVQHQMAQSNHHHSQSVQSHQLGNQVIHSPSSHHQQSMHNHMSSQEVSSGQNQHSPHQQSNANHHQQSYLESQQSIQNQTQLYHMQQSHKQALQNHKMQQQLLQSHHSLQSQGHHQYQSHQQSFQNHQAHQLKMSKYHSHNQGMSNLQQSQHMSSQNQMSQQAQMVNQQASSHHQQSHPKPVMRQSPHQQKLSRQSPLISSPSLHIPSHGQLGYSPHLQRQSPLTATQQPSASPQMSYQTAMTRQSPLAASHHPSLSTPSPHLPSSHVPQSFTSQPPANQQNAFSTPATAASVSPKATGPTSTLAPVKRESPLDLSVKTIRQSADSTADHERVYTFHNELLWGKPSSSGYQQVKGKEPAARLPPVSTFGKGLFPEQGGSRPGPEEGPPPPKVAKVDTWKQNMDKQIEKRFNSYLTAMAEKRPGEHKVGADKRVLSILRNSLETRNQALPSKPSPSTVRQNLGVERPGRLHFPRAMDSIAGQRPAAVQDVVDITDDDEGSPPPASRPQTLTLLPPSQHHGYQAQHHNQQSQHHNYQQTQHQSHQQGQHHNHLQTQNHNHPQTQHQNHQQSQHHNHPQIQPNNHLQSQHHNHLQTQHHNHQLTQQPASKGELDGLAAFLAARIRTKAELKQVPRASSPSRNGGPGSTTIPGPIFSSQQDKDLVTSISNNESHSVSGNGITNITWSNNSLRLSKEGNHLAGTISRTRTGPATGTQPERSTSETSVFDFRDSDSEGTDSAGRRAAPVSSALPPPPSQLTPEDEEEFNKWIALCEEFMTQLKDNKIMRKKMKIKLDDGTIIKDEVEENYDGEGVCLKSDGKSFGENERALISVRMKEQRRAGWKKPRLGVARASRKEGVRRGKTKAGVGRSRGWEAEVGRLKARGWEAGGLKRTHPRPPASLPDLERLGQEPVSEPDEDCSTIASTLSKEKSFLDRLMQRYLDRRKKSKNYDDKDLRSSTSELLPTPKSEERHLGNETIAGFRDDLPAEADLPPDLKPKTLQIKTKTNDIFENERPASAPPPGTSKRELRRNNAKNKSRFVSKKKGLLLKKGVAPRSIPEKRFKTFRRKLKSSGFDYIRKKKKATVRREGEPMRERKKKTAPLTEEEIQAEIKGWVLNKGIGETLLHRAAKLGNVEVVHYCLEKLHHNPAPRDNAGYTPLHVTCARGHLQVAHLLLKYGASVSDSALGGVRALHEAAENGFTKLVKLLLDHGADPLLATYSGATPLSLATDQEAKALMQLHLQARPSQTDIESAGSSEKEERRVEVDGFEVEESSVILPNLYRLMNEPRTDSWVLFHELAPLLRVKTREALLKQLGQDAKTVLRDMKLSEFYEKAHCRAIKGSAGPKTPKVTLVKYTDTVKFLLGVETTLIPR